MKTLFFLAAMLLAFASPASALSIPCDNPKLVLAPYVWRQSGSGDSARAEATLPGAYIKAAFTGSTKVGLVIDATANVGSEPIAVPTLTWSVDGNAFQTQTINRQGGVYTLPLADNLKPADAHRVEVYFRAATLGDHRWNDSVDHLRISGLALDDGGSLADFPRRKKLAMFYGDSITEGVGVERPFVNWQNITVNNAVKTWAPLLASSLDCEYGQIGSGGVGMVRKMGIPPVVDSWSNYDKDHSRLQNGLLSPEPDYIFNNLGTNDQGLDITEGYGKWINEVRKAAPHARVFCIVPLMGLHRGEITAAVDAARKGGDTLVYLIDLPELQPGYYHGAPGETLYAYDGCHPTIYGHGIAATHMAAQVQKILEASP